MKRSIEKRLDDLESGSDDTTEVVIRQSVIDRDGSRLGLSSELRVWKDGSGDRCSERTEYDLPNDH